MATSHESETLLLRVASLQPEMAPNIVRTGATSGSWQWVVSQSSLSYPYLSTIGAVDGGSLWFSLVLGDLWC